MKFRQYIPVKTDPAANPDPATFCPAHGYSTPDDVWTDPFTLVQPDTDEIILLCDDGGYGFLYLKCNTSLGSVRLTLLDAAGSILDTTTFPVNSGFKYTFPTQNTGTFYQVKLSADTAGEHITAYAGDSTPLGYPNRDLNIYKAIFNTPNLEDLTSAFYYHTSLAEVIFLTAMDSLTTIANIFNYSTVFSVTWPSSMTALTGASGAFSYSTKFKFLDWSTYVLDNLTDLSGFARESNLVSIKLPSSLPALFAFQYFAYSAIALSELQLPTSMPNVTQATNSIYNTLLTEVTFPEMQDLSYVTYFIAKNRLMKKITMVGTCNVSTISNMFYSNIDLEELYLPDIMPNMGTTSGLASGCNKLRKIGMPSNCPSIDPAQFSSGIGSFYLLEEITREITTPPSEAYISILSHELKSFYQPALKPTALTIGYSSTMKAPLTRIDVDWANGSYSASSTPVIIRANLDATELNRIFSLLPTVTSLSIDVRYCDGYATCDPSIATAKGWTVL